MGIEGSAAALYFQIFRESIPAEWEFLSRVKHPPTDPVNVLLSFGYTILYHHISTALQAAGLNPSIGLYHKPSERFYALSADLQEEFRHLIDSLVLYIIHRNIVKIEYFTLSPDARYPCLMNRDFKKQYIAMVEEKLKTEITPAGETKSISYLKYFYRNAVMVRNILNDPAIQYKPLRIR
jgi:CRISPR-associated protein Cas1